ncbi:hypothetical protein PS3A_55420 [Pseudomonas sp. 3A(2025)]
MRLFEKTLDSGGHDLAEVNQAAVSLQGQACTLSTRHIKDGMLRLQFNREVAYYAQGIVKDVETGRKSAKEGLEAIKVEQHSLFDQSAGVGEKSIGLAGGMAQVAAGGGVCYASLGTLCFTFGAALFAHGFNNIYENGRNLVEKRSDVEGPVRKGYQNVAVWAGGTEAHGNMAYLGVDLGLSIYGLSRKVVKPDAWRLWHYANTDYVRAYQNASRRALILEAAADALAGRSMLKEWKKINE